jgi:hypothetical protein
MGLLSSAGIGNNVSDNKILCACGCGAADGRMTPMQYLENYCREQGIEVPVADERCQVYHEDGSVIEYASLEDAFFANCIARFGLTTIPAQIN